MLLILTLGIVAPLAARADWDPYPYRRNPGWGNPGWGNRYSTCIVSTPYGTFNGQGSDVGQALAQARDACLREVNNARICVSAPYSCRQ
jgi:hypothetical protein